MNDLTASQRKVIRDRLKKYLGMLYMIMHSSYVKTSKLEDLEKEVCCTLKALSYL